MSRDVSALERQRSGYAPRLPAVLRAGIGGVAVEEGGLTTCLADEDSIRGRFPHTFGRPALRLVGAAAVRPPRPLRVGVVLSGGQAPGGHNVICGIYDALVSLDPGSALVGFVGGPKGVFTGDHRELDGGTIDAYRNTGGFDMIGSGRDKIESAEQLAACRATCEALRLDGLAIIGGDDSNTNAAVLAEYFVEHGAATVVVGVPKTIDGDLKGGAVETSFGFDTATKVYSELIGNISRDARSAGKYWHFVKLMGRSASHVTLECALQTRPNVALIGEEVRERGMTLAEVVEQVAEVVRRRAAAGRHHGVCLVAEGLIEFVPEIRGLIDELNDLLSEQAERFAALDGFDAERDWVMGQLSNAGAGVFKRLPERIQQQLLLDRDSHGNVQVSQIDTEALLTEEVGAMLGRWAEQGRFSGKFQSQRHFFGYEGRCAAPSNFDADYTYGLGHVAAALVADGRTGYICSVGNLGAARDEWQAGAAPLTSMMQIESRKGQPTPVIGKALVRLDGAPFLAFAAARDGWAEDDAYLYPGAIQYFGPTEVCDAPTRTLLLEASG